MTCRHPKRHRMAVNYVDAGRRVCRIDCLRCGGVVPFGPANETDQTLQEAEAAHLAACIPGRCDAVVASTFLPSAVQRAAFRGDNESYLAEIINCDSSLASTWRWAYEIATLARAIYDRNKEDA